MHSKLYELENKRQRYEMLSASAETHVDAIDRGWVLATEDNQGHIEAQRIEYRQLESDILSLKRDCGHKGLLLFDQLIIWNLKTALQMYAQYIESKNDWGVQIICLGSLIRELGDFVGPDKNIFKVNTFHLKEYYSYLEANKPYLLES